MCYKQAEGAPDKYLEPEQEYLQNSASPYIGIFLADFLAFFWRLAPLTHFMGIATLYVATLTRSNFDPVATLTLSNFDP